LLCLSLNFWLTTKSLLIPSPPYSHLAPCDFFLFPELRMLLKVSIFNMNMIQTRSRDKGTKFQTVHYVKSFTHWCSCTVCCVESKGDCFEGDNIDFKGKCCGEICLVWELFDRTTYYDRRTDWVSLLLAFKPEFSAEHLRYEQYFVI
jgi:hypothetical protein